MTKKQKSSSRKKNKSLTSLIKGLTIMTAALAVTAPQNPSDPNFPPHWPNPFDPRCAPRDCEVE
jgi:hypothetical protein